MANKIKTGDIVRVLSSYYPFLTDNMIREAAESGRVETTPLNPLNPRSHRIYEPKSLSQFLRRLPGLPYEHYRQACVDLDIEVFC